VHRTQRPWGHLTICMAVAAATAGFGAADEPPVAAFERVEVRGEGRGRTLEGTIVVEAVDGGLLLEMPDERYELLQPDHIVSRRPLAAGPPEESPRELGRRILAELPAGFDLHVTKHYVVCFNTSREYAAWCAGLFERLHDVFVTFWTNAGLELERPERPLIVVIFADRQAYEAFASRDLGAATDRIVGYYNLLSNRITTFDLTGSDALPRPPGRPVGRAGTDILASPEAASLVSTLVHEATHQMAFNSGMHRRLAPVPLWVSEGIATYFETPDLKNARGWRGIGGVNGPRLDRFLESYRPGCLREIVAGDETFRRADEGLDAYARAWAVTHYLLQTRKAAFADYLRTLAAKPPCGEDSADRRLREFEAAFSEAPDRLEEPLLRYMSRLRPRGP
jgi:hypothetical protein